MPKGALMSGFENPPPPAPNTEKGAGRVGKAHLVKRFAQQEYESCIYIDFSAKEKQVRAYRRAFDVGVFSP